MDGVFDGLLEKLKQQGWPAVYFFKFILPSENEKIAQINELFDEKTAEITMHPSRNGKYTSVSIKELMSNAEAVVEVYKKANEIDGIIIL